MNELSKKNFEINNKIQNTDLDPDKEVILELIQRILSNKIKSGKTDPNFDLTTDALKHCQKKLQNIWQSSFKCH